jgi:hypothetical protein
MNSMSIQCFVLVQVYVLCASHISGGLLYNTDEAVPTQGRKAESLTPVGKACLEPYHILCVKYKKKYKRGFGLMSVHCSPALKYPSVNFCLEKYILCSSGHQI